jgi:hypothetical protein
MPKYALLVLVIFFIGCGKRSDEKIPPYVIPKNKLIPVLIDYHLAQGLSNSTAFRLRTQNYPAINLSDSVLIAHGYSRAQFDSTLLYYSRHINEFNEIYERVVTELNRMQARIIEKKTKAVDSSRTVPEREEIKLLSKHRKQKL